MLGPKTARVFVRKRRNAEGPADNKEVTFTLEILEPLLRLRQVDAAKRLGISLTALKNACKYLGIDNWPKARQEMARIHTEVTSHANVFSAHGNPHSSVQQLVPSIITPNAGCYVVSTETFVHEGVTRVNGTKKLESSAAWEWGMKSLGMEEVMNEGILHAMRDSLHTALHRKLSYNKSLEIGLASNTCHCNDGHVKHDFGGFIRCICAHKEHVGPRFAPSKAIPDVNISQLHAQLKL
eukprot:765204-Hanusia_phi.AAC.1